MHGLNGRDVSYLYYRRQVCYALNENYILADMYNSLQSVTAEGEDESFTPTINSHSDEPQQE